MYLAVAAPTRLTRRPLENKSIAVTLALKNELILSKVLSFMSIQDLKITRFVNKLWKEESRKYFQQRARVQLFETFVDAFVQLKSTKFYNNFAISCIDTDDFSSTKLLNVAVSNGTLIKSLALEFTTTRRVNDFKQYFFKILSKLLHLEELRLNVNTKYLDMWVENETDELKTLPLIRKLDISWLIGEYPSRLKPGDEERLQKICKKLISLTPNLEELTLRGSDSPLNQEFLVAYLGEIVRLQLEWNEMEGTLTEEVATKPFQNLAYITLNIKEIFTEKMLLKCLNLLQPLKGLEIDVTLCYSCKKAHEIASTWEMLICKNSSTLEKVLISYKTREHSEISFNLPEMPNLTQLSLGAWKECSRLKKLEAFNIAELLMEGPNKFYAKFPKLHTLKLREALDYLPPPNSRMDFCFPQITTFEIGQLNWGLENTTEYKQWVKWASKLFPNVHNSVFTQARLK